MNQIKFRAWHKEYNKWCVPYILSFEDIINRECFSASPFDDNDGLQAVTLNEIELMQYVNLKDKYLTEVYVGDIIKTGPMLMQIIEAPGGFMAYALNNIEQTSTANLFHYTYKVVGNIWQNPELLEDN